MRDGESIIQSGVANIKSKMIDSFWDCTSRNSTVQLIVRATQWKAAAVGDEVCWTVVIRSDIDLPESLDHTSLAPARSR